MSVELIGTFNPAFAPVRDALQESLASADEVSGVVSVWSVGHCLVDLQGAS